MASQQGATACRGSIPQASDRLRARRSQEDHLRAEAPPARATAHRSDRQQGATPGQPLVDKAAASGAQHHSMHGNDDNRRMRAEGEG
ncbi:hypothetical protein BHM03_00057195 [Ensete ventricosum]|nr:hypothetical protein BHM03_00057195 [Ensete ventricosum]